MALSYDIKLQTIMGIKQVVVFDVDFDDSYPTNGETVTASSIGLRNIDLLMASPTAGYVFEYDYSNSKLKAYYADYDAASDGALIEVANTTDLSGVTDVRCIAIGDR